MIEGRSHLNWDNAFFLLRAKHSNYDPPHAKQSRNEGLLKIFGTASYRYNENGDIDDLVFYSHHPILSPMLFRIYSKIFGYGNWVPRSFMLIFSLLTTVVLFKLLKTTLKNEWLGLLLTFWYVLLPLNFMYMDQWKYEIPANLLALTSFYFIVKMEDCPVYRPVFLINMFFLLQTEWHVYLVVPCLIFYLFTKRQCAPYAGLYLQTIIICIIAAAINFGILYRLGLHVGNMKEIGMYRLSGGIEHISLKAWVLRQLSFLDMNFGYANVVMYVIGMAYLIFRERLPANILLFAGLTFTLCAVIWTGAFKNLSFIHHYVQWSFGPAYILLLSGIAADFPRRHSRQAKAVIAAMALPLILLTGCDSYQFYHGSRNSIFGKTEDLEVIQSFKERLIVFSDGRSGPPSWWINPVMEMNLDSIFQGLTRTASIHPIETMDALHPHRDILVVLNSKDAWETFPEYCRSRFGVKGFKPVGKSFSFTFFQIE